MKDGGPAFPMAVDCSAGSRTEYQSGMSLRDYFAAKFMARAQSLCTDHDGGWNVESAAASAYEMADAMLLTRDEPTAALEKP